MRLLLVLVLFFPLVASAQKTDTTKREPRLRDFSVGVNGGYGTGNLYSARVDISLNFRKVNFVINGEQSIRRAQGHSFYFIGYRGLGTYYYNFGINPATAFPETFRYPVLNRLTRRATGAVTWNPTKKIEIKLSGSYRLADDSVGFFVQRQVFTGSNFRTTSSVHTGGQLTEQKEASLDLKYPSNADVTIIHFRSDFTEETKDFTLQNSFTDLTSGYPLGFMAVSSNRDIANKVELKNNLSLHKLWLPWVSFDRNEGVGFKRKPIRLGLSHSFRMERGISHLFTRTDLVPENSPAQLGSEQIFYIRSLRPLNDFYATLSIPDLVKFRKPEIEADFVFGAHYSEQPITQSATRIDATGANPEDALYINSLLTTRLFTTTLSFWYRRIGLLLMGSSSEITVHNDSGETISKRRFMLLPRLSFTFKNVEVEYSTVMLSPAAAELLPNPDWRNPAYIEYGNSGLEFGVLNQLSLDREFFKIKTSRRDSTVKYGQRISISATVSHRRNPVMLIAQPDSAGILYARLVNLPYLLNAEAGIDFERQLFPSLNLAGDLYYSWLRYDYSLKDTLRTMNTQTFRAHMSCAYQPGKKMAMKVYGGYTQVYTDYTSNKQFTRSYQSFDGGVSIDVKFFDRLRFFVAGNAIHYLGAQNMEEKSIFYVSTFAEWSKPYGRFSARLSVNDVFNQNFYFTRADAHGMVQQVNGVAQGRYAMLTASWGIWKK